MALKVAIDKVLAGVPSALQDPIRPEFYKCCVEVNTGVCRDVAEAEKDLDAKLAATARIAGSHGVLLAVMGRVARPRPRDDRGPHM